MRETKLAWCACISDLLRMDKRYSMVTVYISRFHIWPTDIHGYRWRRSERDDYALYLININKLFTDVWNHRDHVVHGRCPVWTLHAAHGTVPLFSTMRS